MGRLFICLLFLCLVSFHSYAQESIDNKGELSGTVFADYYWMANHHNPDLKNKNGFWFRRIYVTYDYSFNTTFSSRVRLEMNSAGDFVSDPKMIPKVKDAYLKWNNDRHQILAGISGTPTWGLVEDVWGYRSVEKSPLDLFELGSSRDFGVSFKGQIDETGKLNYHFFLGNGNSNKPDIDKGKKFMLSLAYNITEHLVIEGYTDWNDASNDADTYTAQLFAGYRADKINLGALGAYHEKGNLQENQFKIDLVSFFTNIALNEKTKAYFRVDHLFENYAGGSNNSYIPFAEDAESTFIVGGLDILLEQKIHLLPNIESVFYGQNNVGITPSSDIIPRLTLFYEF